MPALPERTQASVYDVSACSFFTSRSRDFTTFFTSVAALVRLVRNLPMMLSSCYQSLSLKIGG